MHKLSASFRSTFLLSSLTILLTMGVALTSCEPKAKTAVATTVETGKLIKAEKIGVYVFKTKCTNC